MTIGGWSSRVSLGWVVLLVAIGLIAGSAVAAAQAKDTAGAAPPAAHDTAVAIDFRVEIEGATLDGIVGIEGLDSETEVVEFREGSDLVVRKVPGRTKYANIVLKRGYTASANLWEWRRAIVDGEIDRRDGAVIILDKHGTPVVRYNFFEAWPAKWEGPSLGATGNEVGIETIELAVERIERETP